ncbi:DoxX-like family protein [Granulicella pectinivorans]|jgi:hypothetical protein|uniref:DoxX-like family protein n=1 Tax=Granulicella pectinivorans TaxID=474950 RepID=A0A1I6M8D8_9BACT|nr:DoxX family protein [Granulicella pectinivorans]SFS11990.1 DoxX-like family protein [Granulicella pectinivorans]
MHYLRTALQLIAALGLLNVWLVRSRRSSAYRGGNANSMRKEFIVYRLPGWVMYLVGAMTIGSAACLIVGIWAHVLILPAALLVCDLMLAALVMHLKVKDSRIKFLPAFAMFTLGLGICLLSRQP